MVTVSEAELIYIGSVGYGPKLDRLPISRAMHGIRDTLREELGETNAGASIDIVLHIPGSLGEPDFEGLRTGRLSRRKAMIQAEVAVPREMVESSEPAAPLLHLVASAIVAGATEFQRAGIEFDVPAHARAIERTASRLNVPAPRTLTLGRVASIPPDAPMVEVRLSLRGKAPSAPFAVEDELIRLVEDGGLGEFEGNEIGQGEHVMYFVSDDLPRLYRFIVDAVQVIDPSATVHLSGNTEE